MLDSQSKKVILAVAKTFVFGINVLKWILFQNSSLNVIIKFVITIVNGQLRVATYINTVFLVGACV